MKEIHLLPRLCSEIINGSKATEEGKLSQILALINEHGAFWSGIYLLKKDGLHLHIFQGLNACEYIPVTRGICGRAIKERKIQVVTDVTKDDNYLACHPQTKSEIVVPVFKNGKVHGVLDIDFTQSINLNASEIKIIEEIANMIASFLP